MTNNFPPKQLEDLMSKPSVRLIYDAALRQDKQVFLKALASALIRVQRTEHAKCQEAISEARRRAAIENFSPLEES